MWPGMCIKYLERYTRECEDGWHWGELRETCSKSMSYWDFPGGSVVKTPCSQCMGHRFMPGLGSANPHAAQCGWKYIKNNVIYYINLPCIFCFKSPLLPSLPRGNFCSWTWHLSSSWMFLNIVHITAYAYVICVYPRVCIHKQYIALFYMLDISFCSMLFPFKILKIFSCIDTRSSYPSFKPLCNIPLLEYSPADSFVCWWAFRLFPSSSNSASSPILICISLPTCEKISLGQWASNIFATYF